MALCHRWINRIELHPQWFNNNWHNLLRHGARRQEEKGLQGVMGWREMGWYGKNLSFKWRIWPEVGLWSARILRSEVSIGVAGASGRSSRVVVSIQYLGESSYILRTFCRNLVTRYATVLSRQSQLLVAFHVFPAFFTRISAGKNRRRGGQVALQTARRERRRAAGSAGVVAWRSGETGKVLQRMDIWYGYMVWIKKNW